MPASLLALWSLIKPGTKWGDLLVVTFTLLHSRMADSSLVEPPWTWREGCCSSSTSSAWSSSFTSLDPPSGEDTELPCSPCCGMGPWGVESCFFTINFIPLKQYFQLFIALPAGESVPNWMKPTLIVVTLAFQSEPS